MADAANRVVVYYQTQYDHNETTTSQWGHYVSPLPLVQVISHLILAAFHLNLGKPVKLALNDNAPDTAYYTQMWKDVARLKENNVKILGMLGGAAQGSYECLTPEHWKTYYPILRDMIKEYQLDGIDLDVEEAYTLKDVVRLIKQLKADFGPDFIITLAPVASALEDHDGGPSGFDYIQLEKEAGHLISWYNAQFYSGFGSFTPDDQYIDMVEKMNISSNRLVAIVLTSPDNGDGYISTKEVVAGVKSLVKKYGSEFGGIGGWEYFNSLPDPAKPWQWATLMRDTIREARRTLTGASGGGSKTGTGKGKGKGSKSPYPIPPRVGGTRPAATDLPSQQQEGTHERKHPRERASPSGKVYPTTEPSPRSQPTHTPTHTHTHTPPLPMVNGHPFVTGPIKATATVRPATVDSASPTMSASSHAAREERASAGHSKGVPPPPPRSTGEDEVKGVGERQDEDKGQGEESQSKGHSQRQVPSPGFAKSTDPQTPSGAETLSPASAHPVHPVDTSSEDEDKASSDFSDTPTPTPPSSPSSESSQDTPPPPSEVPIKPYHPKKPDYKPHPQYPPAQEAPPPPPAPTKSSEKSSTKPSEKSTSEQSTQPQPQPQPPTPIRPPASPRESAFLSRIVSERLVPLSIAPGETTYFVQQEVEDVPVSPSSGGPAQAEREREKELQGAKGCELGGRCVL